MTIDGRCLTKTLFAPLAIAMFTNGCGSSPSPQPTTSKVYVAVEEGSSLTVLDGNDLHTLGNIPLSGYMAHNVQVAPDGRSVWASLVAMEGMETEMPDQVVVVDPSTDTITDWIELGSEVHPAHVVLTPDSRGAYITGAAENELFRIDTATKKIVARVPLGHGAGAHGTRMSRDGRSVWSAEIDGKCVARTDANAHTTVHIDLEGQAVQVGVTLDDRYVFVSQYDTRSVARIDTTTSEVQYSALPADAQGPIQLYPTPDGEKMLVVDQGVLADRAPSDKLFAIDIASLAITETVTVGLGAHGVVANGNRAYVTAIEDDSVSAVDLETWKLVAQVKVGRKPNGISAWSLEGGTP